MVSFFWFIVRNYSDTSQCGPINLEYNSIYASKYNKMNLKFVCLGLLEQMETINGDLENINNMNDARIGNKESTKSIKEDVKKNVTESTESINNDMKDVFTRFIEKNREMKECCPRGEPVIGKLYFVLDSS